MKKISKKEVITEEDYCDDCGNLAGYKCCACFKDVCGSCVEQHDKEIMDDDPDYYCKKCYAIGKSYRDKIEELEGEIYLLNKEWKKQGKKSRNKK